MFGSAYLGFPVHSTERNEQKNCHRDHTNNTDIIERIHHYGTIALKKINKLLTGIWKYKDLECIILQDAVTYLLLLLLLVILLFVYPHQIAYNLWKANSMERNSQSIGKGKDQPNWCS